MRTHDLDRVPELELMARDLGDLKIVIDHCFMLNTRQKTEETLLALERLAALPNVYAKLTSGTHGSYRVYPYPDMRQTNPTSSSCFQTNSGPISWVATALTGMKPRTLIASPTAAFATKIRSQHRQSVSLLGPLCLQG